MRSQKPKALLEVLFKPMLGWVVDSVKKSNITRIFVVTGYGHKSIERYLSELSLLDNSLILTTVFQSERLGTGHAVLSAKDFLKKEEFEDVVVLSGDTPLLDSKTIKKAYDIHKSQKNSLTLISSEVDDTFGYGRVIRKDKKIYSVVEQKDASEEILKIKEVNSGAYWFNVKDLLSALSLIKNDNAQNEYYLTDTIRILVLQGKKVGNFSSVSSDLILGANDAGQLERVSAVAQNNILEKLQNNDVKIWSTQGVTIGPDVQIGSGCEIFSETIIIGRTLIGTNCKIGPDVILNNQNVASDSVVTKKSFNFC
jgi:bifunctional UDP-N-acetylglucosamine pyrophosphorylase/glucosamine-1-phosphate N-acetyltransferase